MPPCPFVPSCSWNLSHRDTIPNSQAFSHLTNPSGSSGTSQIPDHGKCLEKTPKMTHGEFRGWIGVGSVGFIPENPWKRPKPGRSSLGWRERKILEGFGERRDIPAKNRDELSGASPPLPGKAGMAGSRWWEAAGNLQHTEKVAGKGSRGREWKNPAGKKCGKRRRKVLDVQAEWEVWMWQGGMLGMLLEGRGRRGRQLWQLLKSEFFWDNS